MYAEAIKWSLVALQRGGVKSVAISSADRSLGHRKLLLSLASWHECLCLSCVTTSFIWREMLSPDPFLPLHLSGVTCDLLSPLLEFPLPLMLEWRFQRSNRINSSFSMRLQISSEAFVCTGRYWLRNNRVTAVCRKACLTSPMAWVWPLNPQWQKSEGIWKSPSILLT